MSPIMSTRKRLADTLRRITELIHSHRPADNPTICEICGASLTDTALSLCPDCQELEKDW